MTKKHLLWLVVLAPSGFLFCTESRDESFRDVPPEELSRVVGGVCFVNNATLNCRQNTTCSGTCQQDVETDAYYCNYDLVSINGDASSYDYQQYRPTYPTSNAVDGPGSDGQVQKNWDCGEFAFCNDFCIWSMTDLQYYCDIEQELDTDTQTSEVEDNTPCPMLSSLDRPAKWARANAPLIASNGGGVHVFQR